MPLAPFQLPYAVEPPLLFLPSFPLPRSLSLAPTLPSPRRTDVNSFCHRIKRPRTTPLPDPSLELLGSNDIYAALIGRSPFHVSRHPTALGGDGGPNISSQRHDRSRKSVVRDEIPPKWITRSRLLHPDLASNRLRQYAPDMEEDRILSACGLSKVEPRRVSLDSD